MLFEDAIAEARNGPVSIDLDGERAELTIDDGELVLRYTVRLEPVGVVGGGADQVPPMEKTLVIRLPLDGWGAATKEREQWGARPPRGRWSGIVQRMDEPTMSDLERVRVLSTAGGILRAARDFSGMSWDEIEAASGWEARKIRRVTDYGHEPPWALIRDVVVACGCNLALVLTEGSSLSGYRSTVG